MVLTFSIHEEVGNTNLSDPEVLDNKADDLFELPAQSEFIEEVREDTDFIYIDDEDNDTDDR